MTGPIHARHPSRGGLAHPLQQREAEHPIQQQVV
jgi:hypothetical protein